MIRRFPQSYRAWASVLREFRPPKRPIHPFMSNHELVEVSYPTWLKKTSTKLSNRIMDLLIEQKNNPHHHHHHHIRSSGPGKRRSIDVETATTVFRVPKDVKVDDLDHEDSVLTAQVLEAFEEGDLVLINELLEAAFRNHKTIIDPDLANIIVKLSLSEIPLPGTLPYDLEVEIPMYKAEKPKQELLLMLQNSSPPTKESQLKLDIELNCRPLVTDSSFYRFIYAKIPSLYQICRLYEPILWNLKDFQEYYMWLAFHQNDLSTLRRVLDQYLLTSEHYDSKVLAYSVLAWIMHYDSATAMSIFRQIVELDRPLEPILLEAVLQLALHHDTRFQIIQEMHEMWVANGHSMSPKSIALVLRVLGRFGTKESLDRFIQANITVENHQHYMIRAQGLRNKILARGPSKTYKVVSDDDLREFQDILNTGVLTEEEKKDFYYQMMKFFAEKKNEKMVIYILHCMKKDNMAIDSRIVKVILQLYVRLERYLSLLEFLKLSSTSIQYNDQFVVDIYNGFVKTYPYLAKDFSDIFKSWSKEIPQLFYLHRTLGLELMSPKSMIPARPANASFQKPKYIDGWRHFNANESPESQRIFRFWKGFPSLAERGVKPDFEVVFETYKHLPKKDRYLIKTLLQETRSESTKKKMAIWNLRNGGFAKKYLEDFVRDNKNGLNAQNRLYLVEPLMKKQLTSLARGLLRGIEPNELNDKLTMEKLFKELKVNAALGDMKTFIKCIEEFPLNDIQLNPCLYERCCSVENSIKNRIIHRSRKVNEEKTKEADKSNNCEELKTVGHEEVEINTNDLDDLIVSQEEGLERLQGFIGDVRVRLDSDKIEMKKVMAETFEFLSLWMGEREDIRKV